jgi:cyclophilin family peptidyl-prolyl cis-trans isomerase
MSSRRRIGPILALAAAVLLAAGCGGGGDKESATTASSPTTTSGTGRPALDPAKTYTVTLRTSEGTFAFDLNVKDSPNATASFASLVQKGFFDGLTFHRIVPGFVIQGGDPTGTGTGGPGYTIQDETVTTPYKRGTVAMARSSAPNSVGSQFFIVLDDKDGEILSSANTYQIIGDVTSGMETADAIFAASGGVELPPNPITITTATVATP